VVIGADDRKQVVTYKRELHKKLVYFSYSADGDSRCTGFVVAPGMVVTSGHCFSTRKKAGEGSGRRFDEFENVKVGIGVLKASQMSPTIRVTQVCLVKDFIKTDNSNNDLAVVRLTSTGSAQPMALSSNWNTAAARAELVIAGYSGDKPPYTLWEHAKPLALAIGGKSGPQLVKHSLDTSAGASGSPVTLVTYNASGAATEQAIGIHRGPASGSTPSNEFVAFTPEVMSFIQNAIAGKICK